MVSTLTQRIAALNTQSVAKVKKVQSDFKSKADAITNGLTKVNADAESLRALFGKRSKLIKRSPPAMKDNGDGAKIASAIRGFADLV